MRKFKENNAAIVHNTWSESGAAFPMMIWPSNYYKLAAATMFTLFFAGATFAPNLLVDGVNIQEYLQSHYINAIRQVALRVHGLGIVLGYDTLNEPAPGYIGVEDLAAFPHFQTLKSQECPTPFQAMMLGAGHTVTVDYWERSLLGLKKTGEVLVNSEKVSAWLDGRQCVWASHGVWDADTKTLLKPDYFSSAPDGSKYDFLTHFWVPFVNRYAEAIREVHPNVTCPAFLLSPPLSRCWRLIAPPPPLSL